MLLSIMYCCFVFVIFLSVLLLQPYLWVFSVFYLTHNTHKHIEQIYITHIRFLCERKKVNINKLFNNNTNPFQLSGKQIILVKYLSTIHRERIEIFCECHLVILIIWIFAKLNLITLKNGVENWIGFGMESNGICCALFISCWICCIWYSSRTKINQ